MSDDDKGRKKKTEQSMLIYRSEGGRGEKKKRMNKLVPLAESILRIFLLAQQVIDDWEVEREERRMRKRVRALYYSKV